MLVANPTLFAAAQKEIDMTISRFYMLRHLMRGTLKAATDELWAEILCELEIAKKTVL